MRKIPAVLAVGALGAALALFLYRRAEVEVPKTPTSAPRQGVTDAGSAGIKVLGKEPGATTSVIDATSSIRLKPGSASSIALDQVLSRHRASAKRLNGDREFSSSTEIDAVLHLDEARLWALAYRQDAHDWAIGAFRDDRLDLEDRRLAVSVLGVLAEHGDKDAEVALLGMASAFGQPLAGESLASLLHADRSGSHRDLYHSLARRGDVTAIDALSRWQGDASEQVLSEIAGKQSVDGDPLRDVAYLASNSLKLLQSLKSGSWPDEVRKILIARHDNPLSNGTLWALHTIAQKGGQEFLPVLREHLDRSETELKNFYADRRGEKAPPLESVFGRDFSMGRLDSYYDELLITYAAHGGILSDLEKTRLTGLGYLGDPAENLARLLSAPQ